MWRNVQIVFHSGWSWPVVLVVLAGAVAACLALNRPTRRALGRRAFVLLGAEALCSGLLVLWLVNPRLRYERREGGRGEIALAMDRSLSMATRDAPGGRTRYEAARDLVLAGERDLLRQLGEAGRVRTYVFGANLTEAAPDSLPAQADPSGYGTNLKTAIEGLAGRAVKPRAIVLLSDGVHTDAGDPVEAARAAGVPIYTVGLGRQDAAGTWRNAAVTQVNVPTRLTVGQEVELRAELTHEGFTGSALPVELKMGDQVLASQTVRLGRGGRQEARLKFTPMQRGSMTLGVRAAHLEGDGVAEDDAQDVTVMAAESKLRVLYVEGSLRWIYKFVKRILEREASIQADCVICTGGGKLMQQGQGGQGGLNLRGGLPADMAGMQKYDVIVLGDFPRALLDEAGLKLLDQWVREKKGGLLVIGGPLVLESGDYAGGPLEAMLPAQFNPQSAIRNLQSETQRTGPSAIPAPSLTSLGRGSSVLKGLEDYFPKLALRRVWGVRAPKPGAEVWLESGTRPLLLGQRYGEGRTMLVASDDLWAGALRESGPVEASPTGKFWIQAMLWLAQRDGKGREDDPLVMARCDKSFYNPGETVVIQAQLRKPPEKNSSAGILPANELQAGSLRYDWGTVKGEARMGETIAASLSFTAPDAQGHTMLEWKPKAEGPYMIALTGEQGSEKGKVECKLTVGRPWRELERKGLDEDMLREIARASGGAYCTMQGVGDIAGELEREQERAARFVEKDLMDSPAFFLAFFGLAAMDWIVRRKRNLI